MARKVAEFEATGKITPTDRGFSAMEQAGRRVGPFFTQMAAGAREVARLTQQIDDEFGKGVRDVADEQGRAMTSFLRFSGLEQQDAQRIQEAVIRANEQRGGGGGGAGVRVRGFESDPFGMFGKNWGNASEFGNGGPLLSHLARQHMQRTNTVHGPKNDVEGGGGTAVLRGGPNDVNASGVDVLSGQSSGSAGGVTVLSGQPIPKVPNPIRDALIDGGMDPSQADVVAASLVGRLHAPTAAVNPRFAGATKAEQLRMMGIDPKTGESIGTPEISPAVATIGTPYREAYSVTSNVEGTDIGPQGKAISDITAAGWKQALHQRYSGATDTQSSPLTQFEASQGFQTPETSGQAVINSPQGSQLTERSYYSSQDNYGIQPTTTDTWASSWGGSKTWDSSAPVSTPTPTDPGTVSPGSGNSPDLWAGMSGSL